MSKGWWFIWVLRRPWEPSLRGPWKCSQEKKQILHISCPVDNLVDQHFRFGALFQVKAGLIMFHEQKSACCIHHLCNMVVALFFSMCCLNMWDHITSYSFAPFNYNVMVFKYSLCHTILYPTGGFGESYVWANRDFLQHLLPLDVDDVDGLHTIRFMINVSNFFIRWCPFPRQKKSRAETVPGAILHQDKKEGYEGTEFWSPRKLQPRMFVLDDVRMVQTLRQAVELPTSEETTDIMGKNILTYIIYRNNICIICIWKHSVYCISAVYWLIFGGNFGGELPFVSCQVRLGFKFIPASWLFSFGFAEHRCY